MKDRDKTKEQLVEELEELRGRVGELEEVELERKQAETALQESEQRFRKYFHQNLIGMAAVTLDGKWLELNDRLCEILGYPKDELVRKTWMELTHPDDRELALTHYQQLVSGRIDHYTIDKRYVRKDGSTVYTTIAVQAFYRQDGAIDYVLGLMEDITARKQAEEALRQSHERLQAIYDNMVDGLLIADCATGQFLRTNPAMCRMLEYSEEELLSMSVREVHPAEVVPAVLEQFHTQPEGQRMVTESRPMVRKDGTVFYADINNVRISYQGRPCVIGLFRDITERKRAREALRQSHDELRAIYDGMVDGMHILDLVAMKAVRANPALCRMMGYSEEEILSLSRADVHPPEDQPRVFEGFQAYMEGRASMGTDVPLLRKDGSVFYADITASRIVYNEAPSLMCFFRDTTERRKAQEALRQERRTLEHMLRASDHERQLIAYDIHDGLAQELAGAIMQFQIYAQFKDVRPDEARKAYEGGVTLLRQGHSEARRLISGVRPPILDESGVVAAVAHLVHDPAFDRGPRIDFRSRVTFNRLNPVMENVIYRIAQEGLSNARNHSKSKKIRVSLLQRGNRLRIEIRDWGVGFDPATVAENRFGLNGIRERARLLGGKCRIKSKLGEGTVVVVELPVVERDVK